MASIIKKVKGKRVYYYAVESKRVNGKPRIVWQKYLGTLDSIIKRAADTSVPEVKELEIFEAGGIAAMLRIADQINLMDIINEVVPKRDQGPSIGHYIMLAVINRVLDPCSKLQMPDWYHNTVLQRLWRYPKDSFTSQRFWDHMDLIAEADLEKIQDKISARIKEVFRIDPKVVLYDTTNFFTYIRTNNQRNTIAQRGRSKAKRNDLRQVGLALLVTKEFHIPLFHKVYQGNIPDVKIFPEIAKELKGRYGEILGPCKESTLVFDKGNISDMAMENVLAAGQHFVCAISKSMVHEIFSTPLEKLMHIPDLPGTKAECTNIEIWGKSCIAVLTYTESLFTSQLMNTTINLQKCQQRLLDLDHSLKKWEKKPDNKGRPSVKDVKKNVQKILSVEHMNELMTVDIVEKNGLISLQYSVNQDKLDNLSKHDFGRTLIVTTRQEWTAKEIISTYRGQNYIESAFKNMKDTDFLHWQPAFHWTDQKIKVHGLYCVLALLLASLAHKKVVESGIDVSLPKMLEELSRIREVALIYAEDESGARKNRLNLSKLSPSQKKIADCLEIVTSLAG